MDKYDRLTDLSMRVIRGELDAAFRRGLAAALSESQEIARLREALHRIAIVDQGAGGNLSYEEMAKSAMAQAREALLPHQQSETAQRTSQEPKA